MNCPIFRLTVLALMLHAAHVLAQPKPAASADKLPPDHAQRMRAGTELFRKSVRNTLRAHCVRCHGGDKTRSGFDLTTRKGLLKGGDSGEVIDLQQPRESYLLQLIRHQEEPTMPPAQKKLAAPLLADIQRWIELGAPYDKPLIERRDPRPTAMRVTDQDRAFWSFQPLSRQDPPPAESAWPRTDVDRFVWARLREEGLSPNPPADERARIRRAYLDVIGLPPTLPQLDEALAMSHEELVETLLASPHYGERWARHWLDTARFAESHGFEQDYDRPYAYHYRDFVIKAFNSDMPWDQFVRWQIAGDEIAPKDPLALMATGFLGAGVFPTQLTEKEFESARYDELDDMAATIGTAMLGLTIGCARCHDHKFDPLPTADYYRFIATFTTTIRSEVEVDLEPHKYQAAFASWEDELAQARSARIAYENSPPFAKAFDQWLAMTQSSSIGKADWTVLEVSRAQSSDKATTLTPQPDGAILASGNPPARETYTVAATTRVNPIRFIRIEALTHESMKRNGPGRAGNGNFALSDLQLFATRNDDSGTAKTEVQWKSAAATHQQNSAHLSVDSAVDDDPAATGWAVDKGGIGHDQAAVFELEQPFMAPDGVELEFQLTFANNGQHSLGRFRLSASSSLKPPVVVGRGDPEALRDALAAAARGDLLPTHRKTLRPIFAPTDPSWVRLHKQEQAVLARKPEPQRTTVQVSSEGFPPTKHHADGRGFPHFYPQTHLLRRGDPNQKQAVAEAGFLQVLMRNGKSSSEWLQPPPSGWTRTSYRRTGMARWLTDPQDGAGHLLARVIVNRLWQHHFGRGIVATPNDFGLQGTPPSHPELLDFLAQRLIDGGWKLKPLHREILLSATWLQSTAVSAAKAGRDPENRWLSRYPLRRLEAEVVRDTMLAASGQLDTRMFGQGTLDPAHRRRSIYFMVKRSRLVPMMQIFDQPEPLTSQGQRPSTTIAPQALLFMNNDQVVKWSAALAGQVESASTDAAIRKIYLRALAREPTASEQEACRTFVEAQLASYGERKDRRQLALADLCQVVFGLNEFIYLP